MTSSATGWCWRGAAVRLGATDDVMLMSYVLDAGKGSHDAVKLAERYFGREPSRFKDVKNKDKALFTPEATPIERSIVLCGGRHRHHPAAVAGVEAAHGGGAGRQRL